VVWRIEGPPLFFICLYNDLNRKINRQASGRNVLLMNDSSLPQLLLWLFPLGPWSNSALFIRGSFFSGSHYRTQTKWKNHINCRLEKCKQTLAAGHAEAEHLIVKPLLFCLQVAAGKVEGKKREKRNTWHERLLVNNLQGHTEHVRPTKTIQLRALRLPSSARAWPNPCFVLIGRCCGHQGGKR